jgi:hypothetical protein
LQDIREGDVSSQKKRAGIYLPTDEGCSYPMGRIHAVFKADGDETDGRYSISEWWLEPHTKGPGAHSHEEDDVFFVIEGTMSFLADVVWADFDSRGHLAVATAGGELKVLEIKDGDFETLFSHDMNPLRPDPVEAPAWATQW